MDELLDFSYEYVTQSDLGKSIPFLNETITVAAIAEPANILNVEHRTWIFSDHFVPDCGTLIYTAVRRFIDNNKFDKQQSINENTKLNLRVVSNQNDES